MILHGVLLPQDSAPETHACCPSGDAGIARGQGCLEALPHHGCWCHTGELSFLPLALGEPQGTGLGGPPSPLQLRPAAFLLLPQTHFLSCSLEEGGLGRTWSEDLVAQAGQMGLAAF